MYFALVLLASLDLPEAPFPPEVKLRGKSAPPEVFRAQAKRIVSPIEPNLSTVASYAEGTIDKLFSESLQLSAAVAGKTKFLVPVDFSKLPGSGNGIGDTIRVYGVVKNSKLHAYWWEYWLPGLDLSAKVVAKIDADGRRRVVGTAVNNSARVVGDLKVGLMLHGSKVNAPIQKSIDVGDLNPGEAKEFSAAFALPDDESRKATNVIVRVASYRKGKEDPPTPPKAKSLAKLD